jgi:histidinol dehydrogenase
MLRIFDVPSAREGILKRKAMDETVLNPAAAARLREIFGREINAAEAVSAILAEVRKEGDPALRRWTEALDGSAPANVRVPAADLQSALTGLQPELRAALELSIRRVCEFHRRQPLTSWVDQGMGGTLGQLIRPIRRVGLYVPAGSSPLPSSVIMSAVPAQVAGVKEIVLAAPPDRKTGQIAPVILATAALLGLDEVYQMGGAQAVAALAYGTQSVPSVDKIFGPGNLFVTLAKKQVYGTVGIDGLAGPTETVVIADEEARPAWVAADLLAQAEHDPLASAILLTPSRKLADAVAAEVGQQAAALSRKDIILASLAANGGAVVTATLEEAIELANTYGPEHLCLAVKDPWQWVEIISCAGGIFMGEYSCEVLGDYAAGPSHVMPTSGTARFASPLNVWDFVHIVSLVGLNRESARDTAAAAAVIARAEGLDGHARAAEARL